MWVVQLEETPALELPYVIAASGGGRSQEVTLPVLEGRVNALPEGIEALVAVADLQGYETNRVPEAHRRLVSHTLAAALDRYFEADGTDPLRVGVLLAGDLYALPDLKRRGGLGDVDGVWADWSARYRWVAGVAGNHDLFGGRAQVEGALSGVPRVHLLDGVRVELDGLHIAGISGVIGRSGKAWRRTEESWREAAESLLVDPLDLFLLHEGPDSPELKLIGNPVVRRALLRAPARPLVVFGHCHWRQPLVSLGAGVQVLNVDGRAVILRG